MGQYGELYLQIAMLDLEPIRKDLEACYSPHHPGKKAYDAVAMFRTLLLMVMRNWSSLSTWPKELEGHPELQILSGFELGEFPKRTTLHDFIDRLRDGPYHLRKICPVCHPEKEATRIMAKVFLRNFPKAKEKTKANRNEKKTFKSEKLTQLTTREAEEAIQKQELPKDFATRLNEMLMKCVIVKSAEYGFLGDIKKLLVSGDSSAIQSQANGRGHKICDCFSKGIKKCECDRLYADPDATWGYDSTNKVKFFGFRSHVYSVYYNQHDLPLYLSVKPANMPDVILGTEDLVSLFLLLQKHLPQGRIKYAAFDAAYDANAFYDFLVFIGIDSLIPLNPGNISPTPPSFFKRNKEGTPLCSGGLPMKFKGANNARRQNVYMCPAKYQGRTNKELTWKVRKGICPKAELCQPESEMGPLLYLRFDDDHRYNTAVARESNKFKKLYKQRTSAERIFAQCEKNIFSSQIYRRMHLYQMHVAHQAFNIHTRLWVRTRFPDANFDDGEQVLKYLKEILNDLKSRIHTEIQAKE